MKKLFAFLFLFGLPCLVNAEIIKSSKEEPVLVRYVASTLTASTSTIVIDLSDTSNFPHKNTGAINIVAARIQVAKVAASSGTVKLGVLYRVDNSSSDVKFFYSLDYSQNTADTILIENVDFNTFLRRLKVTSSNSTPFFLSNDTSLASTTFQNDVALPTPYGTANSGKGDIVMVFTNSGSNATNITIDLLYNSEP